MKNNKLIYLGYLIPSVFWITLILCGSMLQNYNHFSDLVSALGAIGTRTQYLFTFGLVLCSILNLIFVVSLLKKCKEYKLNIIPILFLIPYSFLAGPAIFPMPTPLHEVSGLPFVLVMIAPILGFIFWKKSKIIKHLKFFSSLASIFILLSFLIFFPNILTDLFGLKQRFLYLGYSTWFVFLSYSFSILQKT